MKPTNRRDEWRDDIREANYVARASGWRLALWILAAVVFFGAIGGGIWAFKVANSDLKGAGDQTRIVNDGRNRVNAQEWFHGQYEQIRSTDRRIDQAAADLAAKPDDINRTNYTGLVNRCMEMVGNYNAEARKISRGKWLDPNLPAQIDNTDPATDCRETATPANPGRNPR